MEYAGSPEYLQSAKDTKMNLLHCLDELVTTHHAKSQMRHVGLASFGRTKSTDTDPHQLVQLRELVDRALNLHWRPDHAPINLRTGHSYV
jgi:hypothetical protein